jgi:hypothetical protein
MKRLISFALLVAMVATFGLTAPAGATALTTLSLAKTTAAGGSSISSYVRIDVAAPAAGVVVSLSSTNTARATVPASVTVPAGKVTASFTVKTYAVTSNSTVAIRATYNGVMKSVTVTLTPSKLVTLAGPANVAGPSSTKGTVQLDGTAPSSGLVVSLSSSKSSALSVPSSVTVGAGKSSATFVIGVGTVTVDTSVTITATGGGATKTLAVKVSPATLAPLTFTPTTIYGGKTTKGTVSLYQPAPTGGAVVNLSSSAPGVLPVPASVTIPAGAKSASFTLTSVSGMPSTAATITATHRVTTRTAKVTVSPAPIVVSKITLTPNPVGSQSPVTATFQLSGAAPAGGTSVTITSSNATLFPIGGTFTVPAGQSKLVLTRTTGNVSTATNVVVTATANGVSITYTLPLKPWALNSLAVSSTSVISYSAVTATVTLTGPAPAGGATVAMSAPQVSALILPTTVFVPAGQTAVSFQMTAKKVDLNTDVLIGASGGTKTDLEKITVVPLQVVSWGSIPSNTRGGLTVETTITINGPAPTGGAAILITSSVPDISVVPATVVVPAGQTVGTLLVSAAFVQANVDTVISATLGPAKTITWNLQVRPPLLKEVITATWPTLHERSYTGTVNMIGPAYPETGLTVTLASSDPALVSVPSSVTVAPYATTANFTFTVGTTSAPKYVSISAVYRSVTRTMTIYVVPVGPWGGGWTFYPGWSSDSNVSISLTGPAPAGGLPVAVTYGACITGPATVSVPEGATSVVVPVRGVPVISSSSSNLTVSANGLTATLTASCPVATATLTLGATSVKGGETVSATVSYNVSAPAGGFSPTITSDNTSVVPSMAVTIPAGWTSVTVDLPTNAVPTTTSPKVRVSGASPGPQRTLTVQAPVVSSFSIAPTSVNEGEDAAGSIAIDSPAPSAGLTIALTSNDAAASVPASVTVPEGATSASFTVSGNAVTSNTAVTVTATLNGVNSTAQVTVLDVVFIAEVVEEPVVVTEEPTPAPTETPTPEATAEPEPTEDATPEPTLDATTPEPTVDVPTPEPATETATAEAPAPEPTATEAAASEGEPTPVPEG